MKVEIRDAEKVFGETSGAGDSTRTEAGYEIGAEIEGVWVPFASVGQSQLDHAAQRQAFADAQDEAGGKKPKRSRSEPSGSASSGPEAEPNDASDPSTSDPAA